MGNNKFNLSGVNAGTIARTAVLLLALSNQALAACGKTVLPIDDDEMNTFITTSITIGAAAVAWWKNNSMTEHAQTADNYMKALKHGEPVPAYSR